MIRDNLTQTAISALEEMKGKDLIMMDTRHLSSLFDCMIVVTGTSNRHIRAIANNVRGSLKGTNIKIEGEENGEWILVDVGELIIHIMLPTIRDYYNLEALWGGERPPMMHG